MALLGIQQGISASSNPSCSTGTNWSIADNGSGTSQATYPTQNWTFAGAVTIYGYYVTDNGNTKVCWAELFSAPLNFGAGQTLALSERRRQRRSLPTSRTAPTRKWPSYEKNWLN
jgi:hypothetical protein